MTVLSPFSGGERRRLFSFLPQGARGPAGVGWNPTLFFSTGSDKVEAPGFNYFFLLFVSNTCSPAHVSTDCPSFLSPPPTEEKIGKFPLPSR